MVKHHINSKERLPFMARFGQRLQVVCRSILVIELGDINDQYTWYGSPFGFRGPS